MVGRRRGVRHRQPPVRHRPWRQRPWRCRRGRDGQDQRDQARPQPAAVGAAPGDRARQRAKRRRDQAAPQRRRRPGRPRRARCALRPTGPVRLRGHPVGSRPCSWGAGHAHPGGHRGRQRGRGRGAADWPGRSRGSAHCPPLHRAGGRQPGQPAGPAPRLDPAGPRPPVVATPTHRPALVRADHPRVPSADAVQRRAHRGPSVGLRGHPYRCPAGRCAAARAQRSTTCSSRWPPAHCGSGFATATPCRRLR